MKKILAAIFVVLGVSDLHSQIKANFNFNAENKQQIGSCVISIPKPQNFSNYTGYLYGLFKYHRNNDFLLKHYDTLFPLRKINHEIYVHSFVTFDSHVSKEISIPGVILGSGNKDLYTAWILLDSLDFLKDQPNIIQIEVGIPVRPLMDKAREKTKVDSVNSGINLPKGYSGNNTLIGIIDGGFDFTHPNFYNSDLTTYRIKSAWLQNVNGPSSYYPNGFNYGAEVKIKSDFITIKSDNPYLSHGAHVAGIAAGSGYGSANKFKGVAFGSDILFCSYNVQSTASDSKPFYSYNFGWSSYIADGIEYLNKSSLSMKKPITINMSLGVNYGPKDGTSSFDRFCDNSVRNGMILVGAAGNSAEHNNSLNYNFFGQDSFLYTAVRNLWNINNSWFKGSVDIWGNNNKSIKSRFHYYDNRIIDKIWSSNYVDTKLAKIEFWKLSAQSQDTCFYWVVSEINSINNKSHISYFIDNITVKNDTSFYAFIEVKSINNNVKIASGFSNKYLELSNLDLSNFVFKSGDNKGSIGEIGGTGKNIITVGSYCSKNSIYSINNNSIKSNNWFVNERSLFSSLGPTYDNRMKPDITAPGDFVESSFNSSDVTSTSGDLATNKFIYNLQNYYYGAMSGTSMAAPMVTGIVALWLEAYPELNVNQVKLILQSTAIRDFYVKDQPNSQNYWGYGKIDAYWGMKYLLSQIPARPQLSDGKVKFLCSGDSLVLSAPLGYRYLWNDSQIVRERIIRKPGKYSVRLINENEFLSRWSDTVIVQNMPKANVPNINPASDLNLCEGDNVFLKTDSIKYKFYYWSDGSSDSILKIKNSGYYNLQVGNSLKCMSNPSKTIKVVVYPKPTQPTISYQFPNLISSQTDNNQWYLEGIKIENATGQSYEPLQSGNYTVEVSNKPYNCKNYSNVYYHQYSSESKYNLENNLVFPNPFTDKIQIKNLEMIQKIEIYNMLAQKVKEVDFYQNGSQNIELNLENIPPGSYHLKIVNGLDKTYNQLIIKK